MHYQLASLGAVMILAGIPAAALPESSATIAGGWTWPPFVVIPLLLTAALYSLGIAKMLRKQNRSKAVLGTIVCFALGWVSLLIALDSPIHEIGEQLFWVHMTQHEILMLISAPLLVLGRPLIPFLWALSPSWRERAASLAHAKLFKAFWIWVSAPLSAWLLSALALWIWHIPWLFERTLRSDWIHAAQHTSFLAAALLFWWPLANRISTMGYGGGLVYVFTTILHTSVLGALLTFAPRPWYSSYITTAPLWHLTALEDQQLGGLIMWIPAGTLLLIVALVLLVKWMNESQSRWQYTRMAELSRVCEERIK
ncbi:MAG: cytochrome c oxidase assembly protein [Candidatus Sulfotelmatobacter sp.]